MASKNFLSASGSRPKGFESLPYLHCAAIFLLILLAAACFAGEKGEETKIGVSQWTLKKTDIDKVVQKKRYFYEVRHGFLYASGKFEEGWKDDSMLYESDVDCGVRLDYAGKWLTPKTNLTSDAMKSSFTVNSEFKIWTGSVYCAISPTSPAKDVSILQVVDTSHLTGSAKAALDEIAPGAKGLAGAKIVDATGKMGGILTNFIELAKASAAVDRIEYATKVLDEADRLSAENKIPTETAKAIEHLALYLTAKAAGWIAGMAPLIGETTESHLQRRWRTMPKPPTGTLLLMTDALWAFDGESWTATYPKNSTKASEASTPANATQKSN